MLVVASSSASFDDVFFFVLLRAPVEFPGTHTHTHSLAHAHAQTHTHTLVSGTLGWNCWCVRPLSERFEF